MTTYYLAPSTATPAGSDANAGTITAPWLTLAYAYATASAGDTIYLRAGTWYEGLNALNKANLTIAGYPGEMAVVNPGKLYAEGGGAGEWSYAGGVWTLVPGDLTGPDNTVGLIRTDGYAIPRMASAALVTGDPGSPMSTADDRFYWDIATDTITLNLQSGSNPATQVYVVDGTRRLNNTAAGLIIDNLVIQYAYDGVKSSGTGTIIRNNTIRHTAFQGVLAWGANSYYQNNVIHHIGAPYIYDDLTTWPTAGTLAVNNWVHGLYVYGANVTVNNNHVSLCTGGALTASNNAASATDPDTMTVYDNIFLDWVVFSGPGHLLYNNVIVNADATPGVYAFMYFQGASLTMYHNYIEGRQGAFIGYYGNTGPVVFKNNIVRAQGGLNAVILGSFTASETFDYAGSDLDHNSYDCPAGTLTWKLYAAAGGTPVSYTTLASYRAALQALTGGTDEAASLSQNAKLNASYYPPINSPARAAGVAVSGQRADASGHPRPNPPSIGPYEVAGRFAGRRILLPRGR